MNKTYSVIRDRITGEAVVASELARRTGKHRRIMAFSSVLLLAGGGGVALTLMAPGDALATFCGEMTDANDDSLFCGYQAGVEGSAPISGNMAFGYQARARQNALAIGKGATAARRSVNIGEDSRAIGAGSAEAEGAVGIGVSSRTGNMTVSIGYQSNADRHAWMIQGAVAIGANTVTGSNSVAIGLLASAASGNAVALGANSSVTASNSVALGRGSEANIDNVVSIGSGALKRRLINLADGTSDHHAVTLAQLKQTSDYFKSSGGLDATVTSSNAVAAGAGATANGGGTAFGVGAKAGSNGGGTALGYLAESGWEGVAVGNQSKTTARRTVAIGHAAEATAELGVALGYNAKAAANGVALGALSVADIPNTVSVGVTNGIQRRIVNVAPGTAANDAATFGQLTTTNTNLSNLTNTVNTHTGNINTLTGTSNTHTSQITTLNNNLNTHTGQIAVHNTRIGAVETLAQGTDRTFKANGNSAGNVLQASIAPGVVRAVAIGNDAQSIHNESVVLGSSSRSGGEWTVSVGNNTFKRRIVHVANGQDATDAVNVAQLTQTNTALGLLGGRVDGHDNEMLAFDTRVTAAETQVQTVAGYIQASGSNTASIVGSANNAVAIGSGAQALHGNAVALGAGSFTTASNSISVGSAGNERRVMHVAEGTALTDAVNRGQLNVTNNALGVLTSRVGGHDGDIATLSGRADGHDTDLSLHDGRIGAVEALAQARELHFRGTGTAAASIAAGIENALAIGAGAQATHNDSVALGAGSVSGGTNTVSIGRAESSPGAGDGISRRIVNVADGVALTDAVTVSQLTQTNQNVTTLDTRVGGHDGEIATLTTRANDHDTDIGTLSGRADGHDADLTLHDGRIGAVEALAQAREQYFKGSGSAAAVIAAGADNALAIGAGAQATHNNSVALGAGSTSGGIDTVSVGSAGNERRIVNVADGIGGKDAVNVSQLNTTNTNLNALDVRVSDHDVTLTVQDARIGVVETQAQDTRQHVRGSGSAAASIVSGVDNALALGAGAQAMHEGSVALGAGSFTSANNTISVGSSGNERRIMHVADGTAANDAVNVSQLTQANNAVSVLAGRADGFDVGIAGLSGRADGHDGDIATLVTRADGADTGLATLTTRADGVDTSIGSLSTRVDGHDTQLSAHDGRLGAVETLAQARERYFKGSGNAVALIAAGVEDALALGAGAQATHNDSVALGAGSVSGGVKTVSVGSAGNERRIVNVAAGTSPGDAVNLGQLIQTNQDVLTLAGRADGHDVEIAAHNTRIGQVETLTQATGQYFTGSGNAVASIAAGVDDAIAIGAGALATHENSVALGAGSISGGVKTVSIGSAGNERRIVNVAAGNAPTDAINKAQLDAVVSSGNADVGTLTARVDGHDGELALHDTRLGAVETLAQGTGQHFKASGSGAALIATGTDNALALGAGAQANHDGSVALGAGSISGGVNTVSVGSVGGERRIVNVAAGSDPTDAVNRAQLDALANTGSAGLNALTTRVDGHDADLIAHDTRLGAVETLAQGTGQYLKGSGSGGATVNTGVDNALAIGAGALVTHENSVAIGANSSSGGVNTVSVGSAGNERRIVNVKAGQTPNDAVNMAQLTQTNNDLGILSGRVDGFDANIATLTTRADGMDTTVGTLAGRVDQHDADIAAHQTWIGAVETLARNGGQYVKSSTGAAASIVAGVNDALAIGAGAQVTHDNAVALGAGSSSGGVKTVSVGSAGNERRIVNVAQGTGANDAVNMGQLTQTNHDLGALTLRTDGIDSSIAGLTTRADGVDTSIGNLTTRADNLDNDLAVHNTWIAQVETMAQTTRQYVTGSGSGSASIGSGVDNALAIGAGALVTHDNSVALGAGSMTSAQGSVSVGSAGNERRVMHVAAGQDPNDAVNKAQLDAVEILANTGGAASNHFKASNPAQGTTLAQVAGINATAAGAGAQANAHGASAFGAGAVAGFENSLALGAGSQTYAANTVSVGSTGNERRIANVAAGAAATDAVNYGQWTALKTVVDDNEIRSQDNFALIAANEATINANISKIQANELQINDNISKLVVNDARIENNLNQIVANNHLIGANADEIDSNKVLITSNASDISNNRARLQTTEQYFRGNGSGDATIAAGVIDAVVIGAGARAEHNNAVALGTGSISGGVDTVSIGHVNLQRRLVNVAAGQAPTDAVNKAQLDAAVTSGGADVSALTARVDGHDTELTGLTGRVATVETLAQTTDGYYKGRGTGTAVIGGGVDNALAAGNGAVVSASNSVALGTGANVSHANAIALGAYSVTDDAFTVSVGDVGNGVTRRITSVAAAVDDNDAVTFGQMKEELGKVGGGNADTPYFKANASVDADASGVDSVAAGSAAFASNAGAAVFGANALASGVNALALGAGTTATHQNSIALGAGSRTYAANTVSVGSVGGERRIMNVAAGTALTDAVNVGQLNDAIAGVGNGGGGGNNGGGGSIAQFKASGSAAAVVASGVGNATAVGAGANAGHANAVALGAGSTTSMDNSVSVGSAGAERAITHVADGREGTTDAANMRNLAAVETRATSYVNDAIANIGDRVIESVINNNTFTDHVDAAYDRSVAYTEQVFNEFKADYDVFQQNVDRRFGQMDRKLDRIGAMSTAMVQMASSAGMAGNNRIGAGVGYQGGEAALAVGYQRVSPNRKVNLSLGGAFSGTSSSIGIGTGYSW